MLLTPVNKFFHSVLETVVQLEKDNYSVLEEAGYVEITVVRSGHVSNETKVYVVTKPGTAKAPEDYDGRKQDPDSIVVFEPGTNRLSFV